MKSWKYEYNHESIVVENSVSTCKLFINGSLADKRDGLMCEAELFGTLEHGETVKAHLGGLLEVSCSVHVNNMLLHPVVD